MNILHYTIGLPPRRHGGSVQYAHDLMTEQAAQGHNVFTLTCGDTLFRYGKAKIKPIGKCGNVKVFEITNPLTPTLIYGVSDPIGQHRELRIDNENISKFIKNNRIEILHLHTFQGLHFDIVKYVKSLGIKIIYTSHDFHGVCLKYNLIDYNGNLCGKADASKCAICNAHEPSDMFLRLGSSHLYQTVKQLKFFPKKKVNVPSQQSTTNSKSGNSAISSKSLRPQDFDDLLNYYKEYFSIIDKIHFNSSQTRDVFKKFIPNTDGEVIPVITSGIKDKRKKLSVGEKLIFGFIGNTQEYKGFTMLKEVLMDLKEEGFNNFELKVYARGAIGVDPDCNNIEYCPPYKYSDISDILYHFDGTFVPSKCYETFSLVTLESLAHGRPVIASDHVGAKDILKEYSPEFIFSNDEELKDLLRSILQNPVKLEEVNAKILSMPWKYNNHQHTKEILDYYKN